MTSVNLKYGAAQNPTALALFWKRSAASEQIGMSGQGQSGIHLDCPADSLRGRGEMAAGANKLEPDRLSLAAERDAHTHTLTERLDPKRTVSSQRGGGSHHQDDTLMAFREQLPLFPFSFNDIPG